jgi:hypothetical protein
VFYRINKAQPALWRDPNTIQIGFGNNSVAIEELSISQQQIIEALYSGVVEGQQEVLDETFKAAKGTTQDLIARLGSVMEAKESSSNKFGPWQELAFAELARAALDYDVNPEMVLAERWQRTVHIDQLDKSGSVLAKVLFASGVGKVVTHDDGRVLNTDLGELGYSKDDLGKSRFETFKQELQRLSLPQETKNRFLDLNIKPSKALKISFAITMGHIATRPSTYIRWLNRDVPHLNIIFDMNETKISPIIIPGETPCLNCLAEYEVDKDPAWPALASQLIDLPRTRDDSASLLAATGLALRATLRHLDKSAGFKVSNDEENEYSLGYLLDYATGNVERTKYSFHKLCNCRGLDQV